MEKIICVKGQRKNELIIYEGYVYNFERNVGGKVVFRCTDRRCCGRLQVNEEKTVIFGKKDHIHEKQFQKIYNLLFKKNIYKKIRSTNEDFDYIISKLIEEHKFNSETCNFNMKNVRDYSNEIRRKKLKDENKKGIFAEQDIYTNDGCVFKRFDSGVSDNNQVIIFVSDFFIEIMKNADIFYADSTFKITPLKFYQLHVLHVDYFEKRIPCIYGLMKHKNYESYYKFYNYVKETGIKIEKINLDLEQAQYLAVKENFPDVCICLCSFHLNQIFWRKIQSLCLVEEYLNNLNFTGFCRKILALAYLPPEFIPIGVEELYKLTESCNSYYKKILDAFVENFVVFDKNNIKYIYNWNLYNRILLKLPTSINSLEAWHGNLNKKNYAHPCFEKFCAILKSEEEKTRFLCSGLKNGVISVSYSRKRKQLEIIVENFKHYKTLEYLEVISKLINLKIN